ncbi:MULTISPECIES: TIR domain-containing protein [Agrobacterium tumefaciens complex]|uniref:TIR domain-containing protein n=1 Tax=Agrobacterium tumefaciens complex TaxID=1183400 RepID=UPI0015734C41|nr:MULTISPECIES: TIR domain-containing protein [Agrobacterium tumefaciens complex]MCR6727814.1 TIR domain-containing protein [Agrobacterium fabrum]NTA84136.1 TIR domain-containing protein [Agrobacterium tumefaciens]
MGGGSSGSWSRLGDIRSLEQKAKAALQEGKRNVFISFATEDMNEVNLLRAHAKNENSDIEFNDHSVREPYDSERAAYIKQKITERINRSSVTVVYLSDSTAQSQWVQWEVEKSISLGKRVVAVHPEGKPPTHHPHWLRENQIKVVNWNKLSDELK